MAQHSSHLKVLRHLIIRKERLSIIRKVLWTLYTTVQWEKTILTKVNIQKRPWLLTNKENILVKGITF